MNVGRNRTIRKRGIGYAVGAALALLAGLLAQRHAVDAERKALEEVANMSS